MTGEMLSLRSKQAKQDPPNAKITFKTIRINGFLSINTSKAARNDQERELSDIPRLNIPKPQVWL